LESPTVNRPTALLPRNWPSLLVRSAFLLVMSALYFVVVLVPVYLGDMGAADKDAYWVGIQPEWYFIYRDQNYHDGPTYILARTLLCLMLLCAIPVAFWLGRGLRKAWSNLPRSHKVFHVTALAVSAIIFIGFCASLRVAADWLLQ
jgi:hypothetical protein